MKEKTILKFQSVTYKLLSAIFLSVCIVFSICVHYSFAEVPCKINYQGRLVENNVPVDGTKTMKFTIYNSAVGGDELWTSGNVDITVYNGLFRYVLGEGFIGGSPVDDLSSIDWTAGQELYLQVIVDGEPLTPLEAIYAYPYAINSHLLEGATKEYFINTSGDTQTKRGDLNIMGNVGIGTTSPGGELEVAASSGNADIILNRIGTGSTRLFQYGTSDSFYIGKVGAGNINLYKYGGGNVPSIGLYGDVIYNAGNVGIGTTSPQAKLHLGGTPGPTNGIMFPDGTLQKTAAAMVKQNDMSDVTFYRVDGASPPFTLVNIASGGGVLLGGSLSQGRHNVPQNLQVRMTIDGTANTFSMYHYEIYGGDFARHFPLPLIHFDNSLRIEIIDSAVSNFKGGGIAWVKH